MCKSRLAGTLKHRLAGALAVCILGLAPLSGCSAASFQHDSVALMIPGTSGDGGFLDQSIQGVRDGADKSGWAAHVIEAGYEPIKWQPALDDLANGNTGVVISGTFNVVDIVEQAAAQYPDKKFVLFDAAVNPDKCDGCTNVYSITYRYDETGFLAGILAGLLENADGVERVGNTGVVGVVGGQDIPVINDYIKGFRAGVAAVAPNVKVLAAYAGSFADPVKGKAVAEDMIHQNADIVFTAAGSTDNGVFEAAADNGIWAIGNAASQADNPTLNGVDAVLTAADTNVITSLSDAVQLAAAGNLPVGTTKAFGVKEGAVSITESPVYQRVVPDSVKQQIANVSADVAAGKYEREITGA